MLLEFQSWGVALPRQGPRQLRAEMNRLELHLGSLRPRESLQGGGAYDHCPMTITAALVEERRRRLDQSLEDSRVVFLNNRTPDGFQRLVG